MITKNKLIIAGVILILGASYIYEPKVQQTFGSVASGNEYQSTTTSVAMSIAGTGNVIQTGQGVLGSVVITGGVATNMSIYDATTTIHTDHATDTIAVFKTTTQLGTYTFDAVFTRGLLVTFDGGGVASSTITFKP